METPLKQTITVSKTYFGKHIKRAINAINYSANINSVIIVGKVSLRRIKKAYYKLGFKMEVINKQVILTPIH